MAKETNQIYFDMGNIDNIFTKKYRHLGKEYDKIYTQKKAECNQYISETKDKIKQANEERKSRQLEKQQEKIVKLLMAWIEKEIKQSV